jgi:hypothetical protein
MSIANKEMKPTIEDWQALYQAAIAFKKLGCWEWLNPDHLFGLQHPLSGEIHYCCVLGELGEVLALNLYTGAKGLAGFLKMQHSDGPGVLDVLSLQICLMASFDDRSQLDPSSLKHIKELGFKFRGSQAWPNFQSFIPGYVPWSLTTQDEAQLLTLALVQTIEVATRYQSRTDELLTQDDGQIMILVPESGLNGEYTWHEQWMLPPGIDEALKPEISNFIVNELQLARIQKSVKAKSGVWELDAFFAPLPIDANPRPFFPHFALCVDQQSEQILHAELSQEAGARTDLSQELLNIINKYQMLPEAVYVHNVEVYVQLKPLLDKLKISLVMVEELSLLEGIKENMLEHFSMR